MRKSKSPAEHNADPRRTMTITHGGHHFGIMRARQANAPDSVTLRGLARDEGGSLHTDTLHLGRGRDFGAAEDRDARLVFIESGIAAVEGVGVRLAGWGSLDGDAVEINGGRYTVPAAAWEHALAWADQ